MQCAPLIIQHKLYTEGQCQGGGLRLLAPFGPAVGEPHGGDESVTKGARCVLAQHLNTLLGALEKCKPTLLQEKFGLINGGKSKHQSLD